MSSRGVSSNEMRTPSNKIPPLSSVSSTMIPMVITPMMVVSDHAWLSLFRGSIAKGYVEVALEVRERKERKSKNLWIAM